MESATVTLSRLNCTTVRSQVAIGLGCWLVLALFVGEADLLGRLPLVCAALAVLGLTAGLFLTARRYTCLRRWLGAMDPRWLMVPHLARAGTVWFLVLQERGGLPAGFAIPSGWGGLAVSATAAVLLWVPPDGRAMRGFLLAWNLGGLAELAIAFGMAIYWCLLAPQAMGDMLRLPLSLLPTFVLPLLLFTHGVMVLRLAFGRPRPGRCR